VHGPNVFAGYWRNEAATESGIRDVDERGRRWYKSGDLATFDPERGYAINGRLKELVISGGFNVYPIEVETELLRIPGIRAAGADRRNPTRPAARSPSPSSKSTTASTQKSRSPRCCASDLASFKVPEDALHRSTPCRATRWAKSKSRVCANCS
jgi:acyl-CoA synthetase (AMP-forming)/AMP-acid ligase II